MWNYILVFTGGGLGSLARFALSRWVVSPVQWFPAATFLANSLSSFTLGVLLGYFFYKQNTNQTVALLMVTGFCGGFSTFSTFSYETFQLINSGNFKMAIANVLFNLLACHLAIVAGFFVSRFL